MENLTKILKERVEMKEKDINTLVKTMQGLLTYEWKSIKKLYPRKHRSTIEELLIHLYEEGKVDFAAHRFGRYNYKLVIPESGYVWQVGFIRKR